MTKSRPSFALGSGTVRYADGQMSGDCLSGNYSIARRDCSGSDGNAYGGVLAIQNAADASQATDAILVRSFSGIYRGTGNPPYECVKPRSGTSTSNRFVIRGYENEIPTVHCFFGGDPSPALYVHIYQMKLDSQNYHDSIGVMSADGWRIGEYGFSTEITNMGGQGMLGVSHSELIDLNVHHNGFDGFCTDFPVASGGQCHGVYADDSLFIDGGEYHHNEGYGIHCYTRCRNTTIRNVRAHANRATGILVLNYYDSNPGVVINNAITDGNGSTGLIAAIDQGVYYNITSVGNGSDAISFGGFGTISNSILLGGYSPDVYHLGIGQYLGTISASRNITSGNPSDYFIDAGGGDFRLRSGAGSAIDQGTVNVGGGITIADYIGSAPDIGALEYGNSGPIATPTPQPTAQPTATPRPTATPALTPTPTPVPAGGDTTPPTVRIASPANGSVIARSL